MRALIALVCAVALAGAETAPGGSPRDVDPVTRRRAEEALAAHAAATAPAVPVDPALLERFVAVSATIQEGEACLAKRLAVEAGERYLVAAEQLKAFTAEERQALGARWSTVQAAYTALGRELADSDGLEQAAAAAAVAPDPGR